MKKHSERSLHNTSPKLRGISQKHHIIFPSSIDHHEPVDYPNLQWWKMKSYLRFLTTPTADTPGTTLLLHFDNKRYLIGSLAEGTQRASTQTGVRLLKVSEVFLTGRSEWSNVGGLIGMILTLADAASSSVETSNEDLKKKLYAKLRRDGQGDIDEATLTAKLAQEIKDKTRLRIFGPPNLNYLLATARRFVFRKGMPVDVQEFGENSQAFQPLQNAAQDRRPTWSDENINVWAMPIHPTSGSPPQPTPTGTSSPRKRSYDELTGAEGGRALPTDKIQTAMMAKSVVSEMFDSTWRLDALVETPINEVKLPAALFIKDPTTGKTVKYTGPMPGGSQPVPDVKVLVRRPWPGALIETLPPTEPAKESMSYIIKNHHQRGKFRPQEAMRLEVEKGSKWSQLSNGISVQNIHGQTITSDMVLDEGKEGGAAAIIDLPSEEYVEALVNRPEWKYEEIMSGLGAFIWMLGPGVAANPILRKFMSQMKDQEHIISSSDLCPNRLSMDSAAAATARLMQVDPARYGVPVHSNTYPLHLSTATQIDDTLAKRSMMVQLEPSVEVLDKDVRPYLDIDAVTSAMSPAVLEAAELAQKDIHDSKSALDAWADKLPGKDAEIITLGTGSALPSKYRNVSATLVRVPGWGSLLLDCGENTLGQLKRVYTESEFTGVMQDLKAIWISHMHADHHLGTVSVIKAWYSAVHGARPVPVPSPSSPGFNPEPHFQNQQRLAVISDVPMLHWLHEYSNVEDYGFSRLAPLAITPAHIASNTPSRLNWFLPTSSTQAGEANANEPWSDKIARAAVPVSALGLSDLQAVLVQHCHGARAVSFTFPSGFKASYSGDCRPSKAFSEIGKGSTVCIHEATFDDELQGDAQAKNHTTTSEALSVALAMDAKACVLTHFSQRYQKVPVLEYTDNDDAIPSYDTAATTDDAPAIPEDIVEDAPVENVEATSTYTPMTAPIKQTTIKLKKGTDMKVCVAFDLMRVKVGEIAQLEKMTPALIKLFATEEQEQDEEQDEGGSNANGNANGKQGKKQKQKQKQQGKSKRNN